MGSCFSSSSITDSEPPPPPFPVPQHAPPAPMHSSVDYLKTPLRKESFENALTTLKKYDTVIVVDDSFSMNQDGRWMEAANALSQLTERVQEYDTDGIDIHFLNDTKVGDGLKTKEAVMSLFNSTHPTASTPIGEKLDKLIRDYLRLLAENPSGLKPRNYIVITDGCASDEPEDVIVAIAKILEDKGYPLSQVGIQFLQIGNERAATQFLQKLDDDLKDKHKIRDIVDTTPYLGTQLTSDMILKVLLGGINRREDRKK